MNIYIIRHGQTDWNILKKLQGTEDIPLNDTGRLQAATCAKAFSSINFHRIYTSPLSRARETGTIISSHLHNHPEVIIEPLLIERDFGVASGMTYDGMHEKYFDYPDVLPEGMEDFLVMRSRMVHAAQLCIRNEPKDAENILLISHGASINALLHYVSDGLFGTGSTVLKNTCISLLSYEERTGKFSTVFHNMTPEEFAASV